MIQIDLKNEYCTIIQTHVAPHMRKIVTDWVVEVCEVQQCHSEVFFLSGNYLDRFLSTANINMNQFQLCASVCVLLASKFSQVVSITTAKLVIYTDNSVTVEELRLWEIKILIVLQWELTSVTTQTSVRHVATPIHSSAWDSVWLCTDCSICCSMGVCYQYRQVYSDCYTCPQMHCV